VKKEKYLGRGIHDKQFFESLTNGKLKQMLEVVNSDEHLDVQIRNNYLNIYYNGGNIAKVNSENSVDFDKFYFHLDKKKKLTNENDIIITRDRDLLIERFKNKDYKGYFKVAKETMSAWSEKNPKPERIAQHKLSIENKYGKSDYTIIDLEYQVSTESDFKCTYIPQGKDKPKKPKFDIIAINKEGELYIIELKKGTGALNNTSGLKEHWDCYQESIGRNHQPFMTEMKNILNQKQALGLVDKQVKIINPKPAFMFAYDYNDKQNEDEQLKKFKNECKKVSELIHYIILKKNSFQLKD